MNSKALKVFVIIVVFLNILSIPLVTWAFATKYVYSAYDKASFFSGIWHGLLAPYSLIARWIFSDVIMYATPNTGWFYDAGFLLGVAGSLPIGWIAAIISTLGHIFL